VLRECELGNEVELADAVADQGPDQEPPLEWFEPPTAVLELVPEPLLEPPPPLRAVSEYEQVFEPMVGLEVELVADDETEVSEVAEPAEEAGLSAVAERPEVVMPDPPELDEFVAAPLYLPRRPSMQQRVRGLRERALSLLGRSSAGGRRVPDHLKREAYLADWRDDATRARGGTLEWSDPLTPEWSLTVQPARAGWLRVDGRYAGLAPAEISIVGPAGKRVLVELMRDGVAVATTELKLDPLMAKIWEPQED